jgi:DNA polymerase IV (DinB-like DNA polymerase)
MPNARRFFTRKFEASRWSSASIQDELKKAESSCNYEARGYGVKAVIPIARAKKLLEKTEAVFLPMNHPYYEEVSDAIMETLEPFADAFEKAGIDEAYLDVTSRSRGEFPEAELIARDIKTKVYAQEQITCTIGVAPNKLLAKMASDYNKPNGLMVISTEEVASFLKNMEIIKIPGVGSKTGEKLRQLGVQTVQDLAAVGSSVLSETLGTALGNYLYNAARGEDDEPVQAREQPTQVSRIATLKTNTHEIYEILPVLSALAHSATEKLSQKSLTCKTVSMIAILSDLSIHTKSRTLDSATSDEKIISQTSEELISQFLSTTPDVMMRRVGVRLSGLSKQSGQTVMSKFLQ